MTKEIELKIIVDKEIDDLFFDLSTWEHDKLKDDIKKKGIKVSLIVSQDGILVCGHQRYRIAQDLKLPRSEIPITIVGFSNREEMIEFAVNDNVLRRNLNMYQKAVLGLRLLPIYKKEAKKRQGTRTDLTSPKVLGDVGDSLKLVADRVGISHESLRKVKMVLESEVTTDLHKDMLLSDERSITSVYKEIKEQEEALVADKNECEEADINPKESSYDYPVPKAFELLRKNFHLNEQLTKEKAVKEKFLRITDKESSMAIVGKTEFAKEILAPFVNTAHEKYNKSFKVSWDKLPGELIKSKFSVRYLSYLCEVLKGLDIDVVDFCMKDNAPIQLQTEEFRFILAPCKRDED